MKKTDYLYFYLVQLLFIRTFASLKRINIQTDESKDKPIRNIKTPYLQR